MNRAFSNRDRLLRKGLKNRGFLEKADAENLQNFAESSLDSQFLSDNRYEHIDAYRGPDLGLYGVDRVAVEGLDSQILFDPLEEQFDLPATLVQLCNGQRGQGEVVGEEHKLLFHLLGVVADSAKGVRVTFGAFGSAQYDGMVAAQSCRLGNGRSRSTGSTRCSAR